MKKIILPKIWPVACHTNNVGKDSTFVAIKGDSLDGTKFIDKAKSQGATQVVVQNARQALSNLSAEAWGYPANKLKIIGVTGTKGKTTTVYALRHILHEAGKKVAMITGVENMIGEHKFAANLTTPQPDYLHMFFAQCVKANMEYVVMEVSAQALSLHRVDDIEFLGTVFTNFEMEHSEFYPDIKDYFAAKCKLFDHLKDDGFIIVNKDDQYLRDNLQINERKLITFGSSDDSDIKLEVKNGGLVGGYGLKSCITDQVRDDRIQSHPESCAELSRSIVSGSSKLSFILNNITYNLNIPGEFNAYNLSCAILCVEQLGLSTNQISKALQSFKTPPGRIETHYLPNGASGVVDYAHTPNSFKNILGLLRKNTDNLIVVFGAGGGKDHQKRPIMGKIAADLCDTVILTNDNPRHENPNQIVKQIIGSNNSDKFIVELDRSKAIKLAYSLSTPGGVIVVLGKGPDEYQIVGSEKSFFSDKNEILNLE